MEVSITRMSQNGQIVIPSDIRKDAKILPSAKFLVINQNGDILLKQLTEEVMKREFMDSISKSEEAYKAGEYLKSDSKADLKQMEKDLMQWKSGIKNDSLKNSKK